MRALRTLEEMQECRRMYENFELMQVRDVLVWDSPSIHNDSRTLYGKARGLGWKIQISCDPPLICGYKSGVRGRMTITRIS